MFIKIKNLSKRHFQNNFFVYFMQTFFLVVGITVGAILINKLNNDERLRVSNYLHWIFKYNTGNSYNYMEIFKSSLLYSIKIFLIIWFMGFTGLGIIIIPIIVFWKGMSIGFTTGFLVNGFGIKGIMFSILGLLPYYLVFIFGFLALSSVGLSYSIYNIKNKNHKVSSKEVLDYSILISLFFCVILIGASIEGFLTPYFLNLIQIGI